MRVQEPANCGRKRRDQRDREVVWRLPDPAEAPLRELPLRLREELPVLREPLFDDPLLLRDDALLLRDEDDALLLRDEDDAVLLRDEPLLPEELLARLRDRLLEPLELDRDRLLALRRERGLARSSRGISARTTSLTSRSSSESRNFAIRSSSRRMLLASCAVSRSPTAVANVSIRL
jgi:hypothetical protein